MEMSAELENEMSAELEDQMRVVSSFFSNQNDISEDFLDLIDNLNEKLEHIKLPYLIESVYNPTIYARYTFEMYVRKYCNTKKPILYFGMNPGPWGMSQTGVPFGEISMVRDWLCIQGPVNKPPCEIKCRPVMGFNCTRTEISGKRFWSFIQSICDTPENFFKTSFVYNYLPQQWLKTNGCNLTPGDFKAAEMQSLFNICDPIFAKVLQLYEVQKIIAIGKFCELRAHKTIQKYLPSSSIEVIYLPHPSPRAVNNNNWNEKAVKIFRHLNLLEYYT